MKLAFSVLVLVILGSLSAAAQTSPGDFTIAVLPDTQYYSKSYPQILSAQTGWIAANAASLNIKLVIGLGDIVDSGSDIGQWQAADLAYRLLDGKVPYVAAIGNHDYVNGNVAGRTSTATNFNSYFGPARYSGKSWYKGQYPSGSNENFYAVLTMGGKQYLILVLECFPRDGALSWAHGVMKNHPGMDTILVTHAYTYADNTRMDRCDSNSAGSFAVGADNDGEQVWEKFASKYSNIVLVFSGHVVQGDGTGRRTDLGKNGNVVNQILSDYQSWPQGGDGYLRLVTIKPASNEVRVLTYSPYLNQWLTGDHHSFTVPYKNMGLPTGGVAVTGKVKNASNCALISGATVTNGTQSVKTGGTGDFSMGVSGPSNFTLHVTTPGISSYQPSSAIRGYQPPEKLITASTGKLSGKAEWNLTPLASATVSLSGGVLRINTSKTTAADGTFNFGWVPYGTYTARICVPGTTQCGSYKVTVNTGASTYLAAEVP